MTEKPLALRLRECAARPETTYSAALIMCDAADELEATPSPASTGAGGDAVREASPTAGMNLGQRIAHVGGRENAAGYVEFGSPMAVQALINHVLRDMAPAAPLTVEEIKALRTAARNDPRCADELWFVLMARAIEARAALSSPAAVPAGDAVRDELGYLIEYSRKTGAPRPMWLTVKGESTTDVNEALRFSRRSDAEGFLSIFLAAKFGDDFLSVYKKRLGNDCYEVTEHMWPALAAAAPALPAGEEGAKPNDNEEATQPWYDLAWASGASRQVSFMGDELESLTFAPGEFEQFCEALLAAKEPSTPAGEEGK